MRRIAFFTVAVILSISLGWSAFAQNLAEAQPRDLVRSFVDDEQRVVLRGNVHPLARAEFDAGAVAPGYRMERMMLGLKLDPERQQMLDQLTQEQQDPDSPNYHRWLTPQEYGEHFGVSENDLQQIVSWLQFHGMQVEPVSTGRRLVIFNGTAAQVQAAFHTPIHAFRVGQELHHANVRDPQIPLALAGVVDGVVSLHDFRSEPMHSLARNASPNFTSGGAHYLAPADFATIYDVAPLYQQSTNGSGQSVAIVARSNIYMSDVQQFRSGFGLPANNPQIILNGNNPGVLSGGEQDEANLDAEWSGAVARNATIDFVVSASTSSSDGVYLSAQYIVNHNLAPVMSTSFGLCEAALGSSGNSFINSLWQQAAAEGITVFVSSGDSGAAGCDASSASRATAGLGVNGLCSTPYSVCVGGTQFNDSNASAYWGWSNAGGTQGSALSYIPENVWNESGSSGLWASGGGASTVYSKPSWQSGKGVPADEKRDVPDVSLTAAGHDGYLVYINGSMWVIGGTSAASPSFAGLMALVVQNSGARQGNANPAFYGSANQQNSGGAAVFHDVTSGNNSVPGVTGFSAGAGYDLATGLGSVDANALVGQWASATTPPGFQLSVPANATVTVGGASVSQSVSTTISGGFKAAVTLSLSGLPKGVTGTLTPATLVSPGSGTSTLKLTAATSAVAGTYAINVSASGAGKSQSRSVSLTVLPAPTFTLAAAPATAVSISTGSSKTVTFTTTGNATFNSAVAFQIKGMPAGMTAQFAPASISAPGSGSSTLTLTAGATVVAGTYSLTVTATGGGVTKTATVSVNVPGFSLSASTSAVSASSKTPAKLVLTTRPLGGFTSAVSFSIAGLPAGVSASFSLVTVQATGSTTLTLTKGSSASVTTVRPVVTASGGNMTQTVTFTLSVTK